MSGFARLRRLSETLPDLGPDGEWLADAIALYLDGEPLDAALGLKVQPGQLRPATAAAIETRNRHLREAAERFGLTAGDLAIGLARYESSSWRRDRALAECPERIRGTPQSCYWHALRSWPRTVNARQCRTIIAAIKPAYSLPPTHARFG
jgi:hypothetical protein